MLTVSIFDALLPVFDSLQEHHRGRVLQAHSAFPATFTFSVMVAVPAAQALAGGHLERYPA
jgi:hypothetical protein